MAMSKLSDNNNICLNDFCSLLNSVSPDYHLVFNNYHTYFCQENKINYQIYCVQREDISFFYFRIPRNQRLESLLKESQILFYWDEKNYKYRMTLNLEQLKQNSPQIKEWIRQTLQSSEIKIPHAS
ncbi:MAG: hypothetical protein CME65_03290 [Halobacteriovoraceae bacterium]|nr:hypothetical protein [Halobacteriovoraceae bacterium]